MPLFKEKRIIYQSSASLNRNTRQSQMKTESIKQYCLHASVSLENLPFLSGLSGMEVVRYFVLK